MSEPELISWAGSTPGQTADDVASEFRDVTPEQVLDTLRRLGLLDSPHVRLVMSTRAAELVRREISKGWPREADHE